MLEFMLGMAIVLAAASVIKGKSKKLAALVLILSMAVLSWNLYQEYRPATADEGIHSFFVAQIEEQSSGEISRHSWHVIVTAPLDGDQLRQLADGVIKEAMEDQDTFNALTIRFYDYPEYIGFGAPLGQVVFAPGGNTARAGEVTAGDYNRMEAKYSLRNKDWGLQLTPQEVEVWALWNEMYYELMTPEDDPKEDEITVAVGQEYGLAPGDVNAILARQVIWTYDNTGQ